MADFVVVPEHHVSHTINLMKKVMGDQGVPLDQTDRLSIQFFAGSVAALEQHPLEESELLKLIEGHPLISIGWEILKSVGEKEPPSSEEIDDMCEVPG